MDGKEIKEKKKDLEKQITNIINMFMVETECQVSEIDAELIEVTQMAGDIQFINIIKIGISI